MRRIPHALSSTLFTLLLLAGCTERGSGSGSTAAAVGSAAVTGRVVVQLGADVPARPAQRLLDLLGRAAPGQVEVRPATERPTLPPGSLLLAFGDTATTTDLIAAAEVQAAGSEGFVLRSAEQGGVTRIAAAGNPPAHDPHGITVNRGVLYGAYALLEELGFAFLHPLDPTVPSGLRLPAPVDRREAPHWPVRGWHLHTMHPLELTEVLNGWGKAGPNDEPGWRAMLGDWEEFCEWAVANRQNEVEWVLLQADSWQAFADGPERQRRLQEVVAIGHAWGLAMGGDAALALRQQHAYHLVRRSGTLADEIAQIHSGVDYLMGCGFDFLSTEMGFSEFTAPDDRKQVAWLDAFAEHLDARWGAEAITKVHVSQGQLAPNYVDPDTGGPLNFNFLPHYADPRLGVMPHTVQHYGLDDPAPTYGAADFAFMREFLQEEVGRRKVVWFPETAYWVSFDVDVPLFLPVYADRRLHDLRLLAEDERAGRMGRGPHAGGRMDGQMVFSSGWEWGYWLQEVVAARAAWDPLDPALTHEDALRRALDPIVRPFGPAADRTRELLVALCRDQRELLIEGQVGGRKPGTVVERNGQAYLQGWETWDELMEMASQIPGVNPAQTQPTKLGLVEMRNGWVPGPDYRAEIEPLLAAMASRFDAHADELEALAAQVPLAARPLYDDLVAAARMTALRAQQVHALYDYVHARNGAPTWALARLAEARAALDAAAALVAAREPHYRVEAERIAGWRPNPTAYEFTYLWTVRSLHFWWRDEGKAVDAPWSPAYLNVIDPLDVAFGEGFWLPLATLARDAGARLGAGGVTDLLDAPPQEPSYPPAGLRNRP